MGVALQRLLLPLQAQEGRAPPLPPVLPRLALLVQTLVDGELQAQPYAQGFAEAGYATGERHWRPVEVLSAALALVGGTGAGAAPTSPAAAGTAFGAALTAAASAGTTAQLESSLALALWKHVDALLASTDSLQVLLVGNIDLPGARSLFAARVQPIALDIPKRPLLLCSSSSSSAFTVSSDWKSSRK